MHEVEVMCAARAEPIFLQARKNPKRGNSEVFQEVGCQGNPISRSKGVTDNRKAGAKVEVSLQVIAFLKHGPP